MVKIGEYKRLYFSITEQMLCGQGVNTHVYAEIDKQRKITKNNSKMKHATQFKRD